jgi:putative acetyltransferase
MKIRRGQLDDPAVRSLLAHHVRTARAETAAGGAHALDLEDLASDDVLFWSAWDDDRLLGVGALKRLSPDEGEIKSMHTVETGRRSGVGTAMLRHIIEAARALGMTRLSLETGSWPFFEPACALYRKHGFTECPPFGGHVEDPNSVFMTLDLGAEPAAIVEARFPEEFAEARLLFEEYAAGLGIDLRFQNFAEELTTLDRVYGPPRGGLLLARHGSRPVGCVAYRVFDGAVCEMKRLYVRPDARRTGLGKRLAELVIARAREDGYRRMVLDTLDSMEAARSLYRSLGFRERPAYYDNPLADAVYMELDLSRGYEVRT